MWSGSQLVALAAMPAILFSHLLSETATWFVIGTCILALIQTTMIITLWINRRKRLRSERALDQQLQFERLVSGISASIISASPDDIEKEVASALHKVLTLLQLDRSCLFDFCPESQRMTLTHHAESPNTPPLQSPIDASLLPWFSAQMRHAKPVSLADVQLDLPADAQQERDFASRIDLKSVLVVPVRKAPASIQGICCHATRKHRAWPPNLVSQVHLIGEILIASLTARHAELALRTSEECYREVVESQRELICRYLPDSTLTFVNEAYCRFFGRRREDLIGRSFLDLIPESSRERTLIHLRSLLSNPRIVPYEHEVLLADGTVSWQQWIDYAILGPDGQVVEFQGIGHDITDRKNAEEAQRRIAHVSRLAALGELTGLIAHEINQPLCAILSNADAAEMLLRDNHNPPLDEIRQILSDIRKDDLRAGDTIRRVRSLLRKREMELQPLDLNETIADVLTLVTGDALKRKVDIQSISHIGPLAVLGDRVHLQHALVNLILNAMDALDKVPATERHVTLRTLRKSDGAAQVLVSDTGPGISPENLPHIFESFFTTKHEGTGLGLTIARSIIEAHGGQIWVENNAAGGATFGFELPLITDGTGQQIHRVE